MPAKFARFARPVKDALIVFLNGLPAERQAEIVEVQMALPLGATISQRLAAFARCCPVLQKLAQILARDQRLALELREHLRELESAPPTVPLAVIERTLRDELGPLERRGIVLVPPAIAEASVAVVIPFRQEAVAGPPDGVFKVLKPGVVDKLNFELQLMDDIGRYLDERCEQLGIPQLDYQESFQQVRDKLSHEIHLDQEQRHFEEAATFYANDPDIQIPKLFDHCTPRVTAMQRVSGGKVTDHSLNGSKQRRRLAQLVAKALIAQPIFSMAKQSMFHSDPHAGNLFLTADNRLAILDWSLVGRLSESQRIAIVQILLGAVTLDDRRIVDELAGLSQRTEIDRRGLALVVQDRLRMVRRGAFPGFTWLVGLLDESFEKGRLRVAADMMLFRKSLHTLQGVVAEIGAGQGVIDDVLFRQFLRHFALEWPKRWVALPDSREFATRLSNLDITNTLASGPSALARFWIEHGLDLCKALKTD